MLFKVDMSSRHGISVLAIQAPGAPARLPDPAQPVNPGERLFVVGPSVRHRNAIFCYIYKFRQRFAVVAEAIGERLGLDLRVLEVYEDNNMLLEDLSCCDAECTC